MTFIEAAYDLKKNYLCRVQKNDRYGENNKHGQRKLHFSKNQAAIPHP